MTISVAIDGRTYTAGKNYHVLQHSGAASEVKAFMPSWAYRAFRDKHSPEEVEGGDVTVVVDGLLVSFGMSKWPDSEVGSADKGGFDFGGGLDAKIDILNEGYTANKSFSVRRDGSGSHGQPSWYVTVDGREISSGSSRPFQITWQASNGSGGFL